MPTRRTTTGTAKKPRWSAAQKAAARQGRPSAPGAPARTSSRSGSRTAASDRRGAPSTRADRNSRSDRPARSDRPGRSDWSPRSDRSDRPARSDRDNFSPRGEKYRRSEADVRNNSPRGEKLTVRVDGDRSNDRDRRYDRSNNRSDRSNDRFDRGDRPARSDRSYDRSNDRDRSDRSNDRDRSYDRSNNRSDRSSDRFDRRPGRSASTRPAAYQPHGDRRHLPVRAEAGFDPESERRAADEWTKSSRTPVSTGPVEVAADNAFAALGLPDRLVERLARDGITEPFPIQAATIPDALAGRDVLGRARTGSGKTLAFGAALLARLAEEDRRPTPRKPRALVLVPTRELAMQVSDALEPLVHVLGLRHKLVAGGLSYTTQISALNRGVDLLIATPGRLNDLLERGAAELDDVGIVVLDEADHMAEMGFLPEITRILDLIPDGGQRMLFSATLDRGVDGLVERYLTDPITHSTDEAQAAVTTMAHHVLLVAPNHKKVVTAEVANRPGRTIVFVRTKLGADRVAQQLREEGVLAAALHGGLSQSVRNRVLGAFRDGRLPVLVATDVAARGIHVDDVSLVLQVDPPADHKDYLHRAGRTARAGEEGAVVTLALPHQRRTMERQLREAGVDARPTAVTPGDDVVATTGARRPSGVPVPDDAYRKLIEGDRRPPRRTPRRPSTGRGPGRPQRRPARSVSD